MRILGVNETQLINQNLLKWLSYFNMEYITEEGLDFYRIHSGLPDALFNLIALPTIQNPTHIPQITAFFKQNKCPYSWWIEEDKITPELKAHFEQENYTCFGDVPGMLLHLEDYKDNETPQGKKQRQAIRQITTVQDLTEWAHIIGQSFGFSTAAEEMYVQKLSPLLNQPNQFIAFGAYQDNQMVTTGCLIIADGIGGLYNLATLEKYRQQGWGIAMHHNRLRYLKQQGIKTAVVQTSPMATQNALKVGFKPKLNYKLYLKTT